MERHGVHDRDGEPRAARDPRQHGGAVHQPARAAERGRRRLSRLRTSTRASRTTSGWSPARTSASSTTTIPVRAPSSTSTSHIADQLELAGLTWKSYQESMGAPCGLTSHGRYAAKHNPFVYFDDINGWDGTPFQPSRALHRPRRRLLAARRRTSPPATLPELRVHHAEPRQRHARRHRSPGRRWLADEVPKILASDALQERRRDLPVVGRRQRPAGDDPPFIVVSPNAQAGLRVAASTTTPARSSRPCRRCWGSRRSLARRTPPPCRS